MQMKMKPIEGGQDHQLQSLIGQKITSMEGDFTDGELLKDKKHSYFFDSESFLNFAHPEKIGLAAVQTKDDLFDTDHSKMKKDIEDKMKELSKEDLEIMMPDAITRYEQTRQSLIKNYDKIMEEIENYDPFKGSTQEILDTDYDNFLYLYSCQQQETHMNAQGQSKKQIDDMKAADLEKKLAVGQRARDSINIYLNTLGGNKKFVKFVHVIQQ